MESIETKYKSVPVPGVETIGSAGKGRSTIFRREGSGKDFPTLPGVETLYQAFSTSCEKHADLPCLGKRAVVVSFSPRAAPSRP